MRSQRAHSPRLLAGILGALLLLSPQLSAAQSAADLTRQGQAAFKLGNEKSMQTARAYFERALQADEKNYEAAWRLAEISYYQWEAAAGWETGEGKKEKRLLDLARHGVQAGQLALRIKPDGVEGLFWLSANLGLWGLTNGVLDSLTQVPNILKHTKRCVELDPEGKFERGGCYRVIGAVYGRLPGFPISIGDKQLAEEYLLKSLIHGGDYGINYNLLAEVYLSWGKPDKAAEALKKALNLMRGRKSYPYWDRRDIERAEVLLVEAQEKMK